MMTEIEQIVYLAGECKRLEEENDSLHKLLDQTRKGFRDGKDLHGLFQILWLNLDRIRAARANAVPADKAT